jgi:hypothetical protein
MAQDIVSSIVAVEEEIQQQLAKERQLAADRLAELRRATGEALAREEAGLQTELAAALAAAREGGATGQAAALPAEARAWADRLAGLDDECLRRCVLREISWLLPGKQR